MTSFPAEMYAATVLLPNKLPDKPEPQSCYLETNWAAAALKDSVVPQRNAPAHAASGTWLQVCTQTVAAFM